MEDLEAKLIDSQEQRFRLIATDGVFSMDGNFAKLDRICELAEKYDAKVGTVLLRFRLPLVVCRFLSMNVSVQRS